MLKIYSYKGCGTCKKAERYLKTKGIEFKLIPIRETPPLKTELKMMISKYDGEFKKLFNTSGQDYRALGLKDKISGMSETEAVNMLNSNGNLVKRPFVLDSNWGIVGFKEDLWDKHF